MNYFFNYELFIRLTLFKIFSARSTSVLKLLLKEVQKVVPSLAEDGCFLEAVFHGILPLWTRRIYYRPEQTIFWKRELLTITEEVFKKAFTLDADRSFQKLAFDVLFNKFLMEYAQKLFDASKSPTSVIPQSLRGKHNELSALSDCHFNLGKK